MLNSTTAHPYGIAYYTPQQYPLVVYRSTIDDRLYMQYSTNTSWTTLDSGLISDGPVDHAQVASDPQGNVYVLYRETTTGLTVLKKLS